MANQIQLLQHETIQQQQVKVGLHQPLQGEVSPWVQQEQEEEENKQY